MSYRYYGTRDHKPTIREVLWKDGIRPSEIVIDVETISLKNRHPVGLGLCVSKNEALYFPLWPDEDNGDVPWELINDSTINRIYHNASFDLEVLKGYNPNPRNITDTLVMAHLMCYPGELHQLVWWCDFWWRGTVRDMKGVLAEAGASTTLDLGEDELAIKCCQDTIATLTVYQHMKNGVNKEHLDVEMALFPLFIKMGRRGIAFDEEARQAFEEELEDEVVYYRQLAEAEGFNPGSPQQVGYILAKRGNFLPFTRGYRGLTTDRKVLEKCPDPIAAMVLQYRHYQKLLGTYIKPLKGQDRAYTRFHLDATTGRISSTERNMQNIPPLIRPMFVPDSGVFTDLDFSQIEMRILAHMSGDRQMKYIFDHGLSIHEQTAAAMGCGYRLAKNTGFAMIYGATEETVMETARTNDIGLARRFMKSWAREYREAWDWIKYQQELGVTTGRVHSILGREFDVTLEDNEGSRRRKSVNYPIQGSAAEIFKRALLKCQHMELANQVHDEILVDGIEDPPDGLDSIIPRLHTPVTMKRMLRWE